MNEHIHIPPAGSTMRITRCGSRAGIIAMAAGDPAGAASGPAPPSTAGRPSPSGRGPSSGSPRPAGGRPTGRRADGDPRPPRQIADARLPGHATARRAERRDLAAERRLRSIRPSSSSRTRAWSPLPSRTDGGSTASPTPAVRPLPQGRSVVGSPGSSTGPPRRSTCRRPSSRSPRPGARSPGAARRRPSPPPRRSSMTPDGASTGSWPRRTPDPVEPRVFRPPADRARGSTASSTNRRAWKSPRAAVSGRAATIRIPARIRSSPPRSTAFGPPSNRRPAARP